MSSSKRVTSSTPERGIWAFQERVSTLLFNWNAANIALGAMLGKQRGFWRGFGSQAVGWGLINWIIAVIGSHVGRKRHASLSDPESVEVFEKEKTNLRNVLGINWALDLLYIWGGWRFLRGAKPHESTRAGIGAGIMLQGLLLFIFDSLMLREIVALKPIIKRARPKKSVKSEATNHAATD